MSVIKDENKLISTIKRVDQKIDKLNDQKIIAFMEAKTVWHPIGL